MSILDDRSPAFERALERALEQGQRPERDACPESEHLAAWADATLDAGERATVEGHLLSCASCQEEVVLLSRSADPAGEPAREPPRLWAWLRLPLGPTLATAAVGVLAITVALDRWPETQRQAAKVTALQGVEPAAPVEKRAKAPHERALGDAVEEFDDRVANEESVRDHDLAPESGAGSAPTVRGSGGAYRAEAPEPARERQAKPSAPVAPPPAVAPPAAVAAKAPDTTKATRDFAEAKKDEVGQRRDARSGLAGFREESAALEAAPAELAEKADGGFARADAPTAAVTAPQPQRESLDALGGTLVPWTEVAAPSGNVRWRFARGRSLERTAGVGAPWEPVDAPSGLELEAGLALSDEEIWFVGRDGLVVRATDGRTFERLPRPTRKDLVAVVRGTDGAVVVRTVFGEAFATRDAATWSALP